MTSARISIPLATVLVAAAFAGPAQAEVTPSVTVFGTHVEMVGNDAASVGFGVSVVRKTGPAALAATSTRIRAVIAAVTKAGVIDPADISTGRISIRKIIVRDRDGKPIGTQFRSGQSINVTVMDVKRTGAVVAAGVKAGATGVNGPRFFVSDSEARYQDALLRAFDVAKDKAQALATRAGRTLGPALSITEGGGVVSIEGPRTADQGAGAPAAPAPPVRPGKSRVRGEVSVVFELQ